MPIPRLTDEQWHIVVSAINGPPDVLLARATELLPNNPKDKDIQDLHEAIARRLVENTPDPQTTTATWTMLLSGLLWSIRPLKALPLGPSMDVDWVVHLVADVANGTLVWDWDDLRALLISPTNPAIAANVARGLSAAVSETSTPHPSLQTQVPRTVCAGLAAAVSGIRPTVEQQMATVVWFNAARLQTKLSPTSTRSDIAQVVEFVSNVRALLTGLKPGRAQAERTVWNKDVAFLAQRLLDPSVGSANLSTSDRLALVADVCAPPHPGESPGVIYGLLASRLLRPTVQKTQLPPGVLDTVVTAWLATQPTLSAVDNVLRIIREASAPPGAIMPPATRRLWDFLGEDYAAQQLARALTDRAAARADDIAQVLPPARVAQVYRQHMTAQCANMPHVLAALEQTVLWENVSPSSAQPPRTPKM